MRIPSACKHRGEQAALVAFGVWQEASCVDRAASFAGDNKGEVRSHMTSMYSLRLSPTGKEVVARMLGMPRMPPGIGEQPLHLSLEDRWLVTGAVVGECGGKYALLPKSISLPGLSLGESVR